MNATSPEVYEEVLEKYLTWVSLRDQRKQKLENWIKWWDLRRKNWSDVSVKYYDINFEQMHK